MPRVLTVLSAFLIAGALAVADDAPILVAPTDVPVPRRTKTTMPVYPTEAQNQGLRGIVVLEIVIGTDGKVEDVKVVRSVAPFDQAAITAVRDWEYEPSRSEGRPVRVRLNVPITFALKLPPMARDPGVPEMRQGAVPGFPPGTAAHAAHVTADVVLDDDGGVADARILEGESPWAEALLNALRTWKFHLEPQDKGMAFTVTADFVPAEKVGAEHVDLKLTKPRHEARPAAADAAPDAGAAKPAPGAVPTPAPAPVASAEPATPPSAAPPPPTAEPAAPPRSFGASPPPPPAGSSAPPPPAPPAPSSTSPASPAAPPTTSAPRPPVASAPAPPPVEIINAPVRPPAAPQGPPESGLSAVRDVVLGPGIPDLAKGRRPVMPPLARLQDVAGLVQVRFSVDGAGDASVGEVTGPEMLKKAAHETVASWSFRRTRVERLHLVATFKYEGTRASADVRKDEMPSETPAPAPSATPAPAPSASPKAAPAAPSPAPSRSPSPTP